MARDGAIGEPAEKKKTTGARLRDWYRASSPAPETGPPVALEFPLPTDCGPRCPSGAFSSPYRSSAWFRVTGTAGVFGTMKRTRTGWPCC